MAALRVDFANVLGAPTQVCVCLCLCFVFLFLFFIKPRVYCKLTCKGTGIKRYSNFRIYNNSRRVLFFIHSLLPSYTNNGFFFFFFFFRFFLFSFNSELIKKKKTPLQNGVVSGVLTAANN